MRRTVIRSLAVSLGAAACALVGAAAAAAPLPMLWLRTLSNTVDGVTDFRPRIADGVVVWQHGTGSASEIQLYRAGQRVSLTANAAFDENPETDGARVVWQQDAGATYDIAVYDVATGLTTFPFTVANDSADDVFPQVSGATVAWLRGVPGANQFVFTSDTPYITGNQLAHGPIALDGANVAFQETDDKGTPDPSDDDQEILVWNAGVHDIYGLASSTTHNIRPAISGSRVVWQSGADGAGSIWLGDLLGDSSPLYSVTDERNPQIDGDVVVWEHWDGHDFEIYETDVTQTSVIQLTNDSVDDVSPQISGDTVAWVARAAGDSEIWVSRGGSPPELLKQTHHDGRDDVAPRVDALGDIVWQSCTNLGRPNEWCEIVMAPEPQATALVAAALAALGWLAARSARRAVEGSAVRAPHRR
jgi:hypothetical protein